MATGPALDSKKAGSKDVIWRPGWLLKRVWGSLDCNACERGTHIQAISQGCALHNCLPHSAMAWGKGCVCNERRLSATSSCRFAMLRMCSKSQRVLLHQIFIEACQMQKAHGRKWLVHVVMQP
eukprot:901435-Amphidinium_carterae.1